MKPRLHARALTAALALFAAGAALGAFFVLLGPVPFVRALGAVALGAGLAGCALQVHLLGTSPRAVLHLWRRRLASSYAVRGAVPVVAAAYVRAASA